MRTSDSDVVLQILLLGAAVEADQFLVGLDAGEQRRRRSRAVRHLGVHGVCLQKGAFQKFEIKCR